MKIHLASAAILLFGLTSPGQAQNVDPSRTPPGVMPQIPAAEPESPLPSQTPPVEEDLIPQESGSAETSPSLQDVVPFPSESNQPGFQRDVVPQSTEKERQGEGGESGVNPDVIPDRRFETFDEDTRGTPEMAPMPNRDETGGGTRGLPSGGYGIGVPGQ